MSNKVCIDTEILSQTAVQLSQLQHSMQGITSQIASALSAVRLTSLGRTDCIQSLTALKTRSETTANYAGQLSRNVNNVIDIWDQCEKDLISSFTNENSAPSNSVSSNNPSTTTSEGKDSSAWNDFINPWLKKSAGGFGVVGPAVSLFITGIKGGSGYDLAKGITDLTKSGWNAYANISESGYGVVKSLLGLTPALKKETITSTTWSGRFTQAFDNKFSKTIDKTSTWVFATIKSGIDNFKEYKSGNISSFRAVFETVVETGTSVLVTTGATALFTAGLAAIGFVSTPAFVVTAGAATLTVGADWLSKKITGAICGKEYGIVDGIGHLAGEAYDSTIEIASNVVNDVKDLGKKAIDVGKAAVSSLQNTMANWGKGLLGAFA